MNQCFWCGGFIQNKSAEVEIPQGAFIHKNSCLPYWQRCFGFKPEPCRDGCGEMVIYYPDPTDWENRHYFMRH